LYASSKCKIKDGISDLKVDQRKISSDEGKANVLNKVFISVFADEDLSSIPEVKERSVGSKLTGFVIHKERFSSAWALRIPISHVDLTVFTLDGSKNWQPCWSALQQCSFKNLEPRDFSGRLEISSIDTIVHKGVVSNTIALSV
jgi:hypothetical protein